MRRSGNRSIRRLSLDRRKARREIGPAMARFARPSTAFVTSDCPVFRQFDRPGGDNALLRPDCSVCCPLSSRAFLIMRSDFEYLKIAAREGVEGNGHTLPPTEFRTVSDQGVANFNRKIAAYAHRSEEHTSELPVTL